MRTTNVFISILSLCIAAAPAMAHKLAPTTVGAYYAGTKKPGNPITFTGGGSYDNDDQTDYDERPRWEWDFDYRGTFTADMNTRSWLANWTYAVPGTYTVAVKYFDDDGQEGNLHTFTILITDLKRLYYVKDHLGSVRVTVDQNGSVVSYDDYDPWGMVLEGRSYNAGQSNDKYKFTGQERDIETGYDYFGARYYDARIGRFFTIDPLAHSLALSSWSPYHYSFNNPVRFKDPTGMMGEDPIDHLNKLTNAVTSFFSSLFDKGSSAKESSQKVAASSSQVSQELSDQVAEMKDAAKLGVQNIGEAIVESSELVNDGSTGALFVGLTIPGTQPVVPIALTVCATSDATKVVGLAMHSLAGGEKFSGQEYLWTIADVTLGNIPKMAKAGQAAQAQFELAKEAFKWQVTTTVDGMQKRKQK